jgi:outer membrane receptor protein involved in Fe transport
MKKNIIFIVFLSFISVLSFAQQEATDKTEVKEKDYPVSATFESGSLIDAQTVVIPEVKTLEMLIQHKFGTIENGRSNLWGIYGSSNIRIGLNYVPCKNVQIGAGLTKKGMIGDKTITDLNLKWSVLQQTRKNTIPVSVALYGNVAIDGRNINDFADRVSVASPVGEVHAVQFSDRLSYFSQLIVARKFNDWLSLQAGASFSHYNLTSYQKVGLPYDHDKVGVHFNGRIKVSPQGSIVFNYDQPLKIKQISEMNEWNDNFPHPKPNLAFGYEVSTGTHAFQIYMASTTSILPQDNIMWNQNEMSDKGFAIGFVITRLWAF